MRPDRRLELFLRIDEVRLNFNTMQEYTPLDDQMHRTTDYRAVYYHVLYKAEGSRNPQTCGWIARL